VKKRQRKGGSGRSSGQKNGGDTSEDNGSAVPLKPSKKKGGFGGGQKKKKKTPQKKKKHKQQKIQNLRKRGIIKGKRKRNRGEIESQWRKGSDESRGGLIGHAKNRSHSRLETKKAKGPGGNKTS